MQRLQACKYPRSQVLQHPCSMHNFAVAIAVTSFKHAHFLCHRSCSALEESTCLAETPSRRCLWLWQPFGVLQECGAPGPCWRAHRHRGGHNLTCKYLCNAGIVLAILHVSTPCNAAAGIPFTSSTILTSLPRYLSKPYRYLHGLCHTKAPAAMRACL